MDAMILAAAVPPAFSGALADFGSGAGAAGLAVASRCPQARVTLVENAPEMTMFARQTLALTENAHLAPRLSLLEADVALTGKSRVTAGLADRSYDFVIMNPPFNDARDRATPAPLKHAAHVMTDGLLEAWIRSAAAVTKPRGGLAVIARPQAIGEILAACDGRFGALRIMPIHPRLDQQAIRIVVTGIKGSRGALSLEPPLVLHETGSNRFSPQADALINGQAGLFG